MKAYYVLIKTLMSVKGYFVVAQSPDHVHQIIIDTDMKYEDVPAENFEYYEIEPKKAHQFCDYKNTGYMN